MGAKADNTREAILDTAQNLILRKGFSGTSLDEIIDGAGITKGGFFYHFNGRAELAKNLLIRYLGDDDRILRGLIEKAQSYSDNPVERLLIFLKLYAEVADGMEDVHPGCLVATYTYESQQFDPEISEMVREGVESWKKHYLSLFQPAVESKSLREPFTAEKLADMLNAILEGGIVLSKVSGSNRILVEQMLLYREILKIAFS